MPYKVPQNPSARSAAVFRYLRKTSGGCTLSGRGLKEVCEIDLSRKVPQWQQMVVSLVYKMAISDFETYDFIPNGKNCLLANIYFEIYFKKTT